MSKKQEKGKVGMVGMKKTRLNKLIAMVLVFMLMFSNFGYTLAAVATSDGFEVITNGFFKKEEVEFKAYFEEDGRESDENISNVNQKAKLKVELTPKVDGYLKEATIRAIAEDGGLPNFKITNIEAFSTEIKAEESEENDKLTNLGQKDNPEESEDVENEVITNTVEESENVITSEEIKEEKIEEDVANTVTSENAVNNNEIANESATQNVVENTVSNEIIENKVENTTVEQNRLPENKVETENTVSDNSTNNNEVTNESVNENVVENTVSNETENETVEENVENEEPVSEVTTPVPQEEEDVLVDEEKVIEEKQEEAEEEKVDFISDAKIISENEVKIINVTEQTVYVIEFEYVQNEELNIEDLYREITLQLSGTFINSDLEEVEVAKEDRVYVGWEYSKDVELKSEYTKFSPFKIGDKVGTIVENKIIVRRNIEDEKYLPIKNTKLEIDVPNFEGKAPIEVSVLASKLLATTGEDIGEVTFSQENWNYDKENGKIQIIVSNEKEGKVQNTKGEDEYTIIYRYEDYTEDITSKLTRNVRLEVEEYSAKENNILRKEIKEEQEIDVNVGELVTYSINTSEDKIEKSKIYANYNSEEALHETEFTSNVTVNILTSDMLENIKIDCSEEVYKDIDGNEFKAEGITYKKIKFNYSDIKNILEKGGNIEIHNKNGELLYTLNKDLIKSETDCEISINYVDGIVVHINNIAVNGTVNFEVTKVIKKCNYDKSALKNFTELESKITAEVKYSNIDQTLQLDKIGVTKGLKESYTRANIYINKENLSTIQENENVEIKVELNNDKEDSDLYINPYFEFVFPRYVKEVHVESINLLYEDGLRVKDFQTYTEEDIVKMRVELSGTQTMFSESTVTNGTNILINVKIKVDEYTPSKEDQIKLYYCNEGVSNYESQTKWSIAKQVPNGILKTTNGFDVALFKYQAPNGMVAINGIRNYDGNLSEIKSVRQGETTKEIQMDSASKIATMDLLTLNNTGNDCSDVVMIGKIPFKGNKDVISGQDLGTTTTGVMKDLIKENIENLNMSTIYYSANPNATKSLEDGANGWRTGEYIGDLNEIRSYMIVVKGNVTPGTVLKYSYDFEIPENLKYEVSMAGSFGVYYNNNTDVAVVYESTKADLVGVTTEAGPKVEAKLEVDIGDGKDIGEFRFLNYTLTVKNTGSMTAENVNVTSPAPTYAQFCKKVNSLGFVIYEPTTKTEEVWNIEKLEPNEEKVFTYRLKTLEIPSIQSYYGHQGNIEHDDNGYYILNQETSEKNYLTVPDIYIESKAIVKVENLAIETESNTTKNKLVDSAFDIKLESVINNKFEVGEEIEYRFVVTNKAGKDLDNGVLEFTLPTELKYLDIAKGYNKHENVNDVNVEFDEITNTVRTESSKIYEYETISFNVSGKIMKPGEDITAFLECSADGINETSEVVSLDFIGGLLEIKQTTNLEGNTVLEQETVEFVISIKNTGTSGLKGVRIKDLISENLENVEITYSGSASGTLYPTNGKLDSLLYAIPDEGEILVKIKGEATTLDGENRKVILNEAYVSADYIEEQKTELISITILNNPNKKEEEEEKEDSFLNQDSEDGREEINNGSSNNSGSSGNDSGKEETTDSSNGSGSGNASNNNNNSDNANNGSDNSNNQNSNNENNSSSSGDQTNTNNNSTNNNANNNSTQNNNTSNNASNNFEQTSNNEETPGIESEENQQEPTYVISGEVWLDTNKDGNKDDGENKASAVKVQLLKDGNMIKSTTTDGNGQYHFAELISGKYSVIFMYDGLEYVATTYQKQGIAETNNSNALETETGKAVTNNLVISNANINNIDLGLQNKDIFDLSINKYVTATVVKDGSNEDRQEYEDSKLAKVEIHSKKISKSTIDVEYKFVIKNEGNISGNATQIVDYLPKDMEFDATRNEGWYLGSDGYLYNETLKETIIKQGETKELKLVLSKKMTADNTGVVSNKVAILSTENEKASKEENSNNSSTQELMITIKTGGAPEIALTIIIVIVIVIIINLFVFKNSFFNPSGKVYKNKETKTTNKAKKFYR